MRARRIGLLAQAVVALLTSACIEVGDYGPFRDAQALDADLAGRWVSVETRAGERLEIFPVPDVIVGRHVPTPPPSLRYSRHVGAPATIAITQLDQPALVWLEHAVRQSAPGSVFARQR